MKLIYITAKKYPSSKVDPFFVKSMAGAFNKILNDRFLFLVRGEASPDLKDINTDSAKIPLRFRRVSYFFWIPVFVFRKKLNSKETVFFSYDPYLLSILVFWRKFLNFRYLICSDWHQLFDDWRDKYVSKNSDFLITTSKRLKNLLVSVCGVDSNKIAVCYGGVNPNPFSEKLKTNREELKKELNLPLDVFLVGYVGGFRSVGLEKGLDTMIRSLVFLNEGIKMVFVGGSKMQIEEYKILAQKEGVSEKCIFVEKQPFTKVIEYEIAIDALVIPYPDKHHFRDYGFPMKVWEYMSSGRPIIYSNLEIIGEVLEGRAHSFVPDDAESLARVISSIYVNKESAEKISSQNLLDVQNYTWKSRAENILKFIQEGNTKI